VTSLPDFAVLLSFSRHTLRWLEPPVDWWFYPPPFAVVFAGLGSLGEAPASLLWLIGIVAAALFDLRAASRLVGLAGHRWRAVLTAGACGLVYYYVQRDLRAANVNLVFLAAVLGGLLCARRGRTSLAGLLLAASIVLKLYSAVLLPYLAWRREWRWLGATAGWGLAFFVALPALAIGADGATRLTADWLARVLAPGEMPGHYKSLAYVARALGDAPPQTATIAARALQAAWLAAIAGYFALTRAQRRAGRSRELEVCDVSLLLLLPLPLSPAFQPPHGVVLLLPTCLLLAAAADPLRPRAVRAAALVLPVAAFLVVKLVSQWPERGAAIMLAVALTGAGVAVVARAGAAGADGPRPPERVEARR